MNILDNWSSSSASTFDVYVLGLPLARILLVQFSENPPTLDVSSFLTTDTLTLLAGYKSPLDQVVVRIGPYLSPIIISLLQ